jgi:hypothetical protein
MSCARVREQRIGLAHRRLAVDAQPLRLAVQRDEQQPDGAIDQDIAETFEHTVAVVVRKRKLRCSGHPDKARHAALEGAIRLAPGVGGGEEEIGRAFDEGLVVGRELRARQLLFQAVGNAAAVESILQPPIAVVEHDAVGHGLAPSLTSRLARFSRLFRVQSYHRLVTLARGVLGHFSEVQGRLGEVPP